MTLAPLTNDEAALLYTVNIRGSSAYPVERMRRKWFVRYWRSWPGLPSAYARKRDAVAAFEAWLELALARWAEMKRATPAARLTAVGIVTE